ncbi:hypothetical protein E2562_022916 [Oryza meyeriana var. granulata]|uniref:Uncharacterized protein n=1 Tax=Oryza meyeriana var. granulata TaxID=110450 RepID=A0A6G1D5N3_9ORYZ|nr:hypothetical protein E2562_022916 [Oryza meyeriana var. granulata]
MAPPRRQSKINHPGAPSLAPPLLWYPVRLIVSSIRAQMMRARTRSDKGIEEVITAEEIGDFSAGSLAPIDG